MQSIRDAIRLLAENESLSGEHAERVAREILDGVATPAQIGAFLAALRLRGERPEHLLAFAHVMRRVAQPVTALGEGSSAGSNLPNLTDTCGTGGDGAQTFNISTAAALVAAGAGARIAKHGNRAVSGAPGSGSADVLAALGVGIECSPEVSAACIAECGFGFFFAPAYHSALRHAAPARREIGIRTILNLLGPLANPAGAQRQVVGVSQPELAHVFAQVFAELGAEHVLVVHGLAAPAGEVDTGIPALDEISLLGPTLVCEVLNGAVQPAYEITPEQFGFARCRLDELGAGDTAEARATCIREILAGGAGPRREITLLNAAAALRAAGLAEEWPDGIARAAQAIDSGAAAHVLERLVQCTQSKATAEC